MQLLGCAPSPSMPLPDLHALVQQCQLNGEDFEVFMAGVLEGPLPTQVECRTRGQSENPEWARQRRGRITGSIVHQAAHYRGEDFDNYVVAKVLGLSAPIANHHLQYGRVTEDVARQLYMDIAVKSHTKFNLRESGFVLSKIDWRFGSSPDAILECTCCGLGVLEIKCPSARRDSEHKQLALSESYLTPDENGNPRLKTSVNYYSQVQLQLYVCDAMYCDFVIYSKASGVHIERIFVDYAWRRSALSKAREFHDIFVTPHLYS
jgi:hypothetical protein